MADDKKIELKVGVDEASLQKTRQLVRELTSDLRKLSEASDGFTKAFGGGSSGGGGSALTLSAGPQRNRPQEAKALHTAGAGRALVQGFIDQKNLFKSLGDGSKDTLRVMTDSLKQAVSHQKREIQDLDRAIAHLTESYDEVGKKMQLWKNSPRMTQALTAERDSIGGQLTGAVGERAKAREALDKLVEQQLGAEGGAGGGGGGIWNRIKGGLTGPGSFGGMLASRFGLRPGMMGSLGLAALGGWAGHQAVNQVWNQNMIQGRSDAAMGQTLGVPAMDIRQGEFRNILARRAIRMDASKNQDFLDENSGWRRFVHGTKAFVTGDFADALSGRAANRAVMTRQNEQTANERNSNPLQDAVLGEAQNYMGTLSTMRAMGIGPGKREKSGLFNLYRMRQAFAGFGDGEIAGAFQNIAGAGERRGAHALIGHALHGEAAGIHGLGGAVGTLQRFGGGAAFGDTVRRMVGGGMDATTGGIAAQFIAAQQAHHGLNLGAGAGTFQGAGLLDMISAGTSGPGGRAVMDQNIRGAQFLQGSLTGQTSPYQAARNSMLAMNVAPGLGAYGANFLSRKMSLTELADAAMGRGGDVSDVFKALGGNRGQAANYFREHSKTLLEGVSAGGLGGTNAGKMAEALANSGMDPREFFKKKMFKKLGLSEKEALAGYAGALSASDSNLDPATAMGLARDLTGAGGVARKGGRAGDPAGGSQEMTLAKEHLKGMSTQVTHATGAIESMTTAVRNFTAMAQMSTRELEMLNSDPNKRMFFEQAVQRLGANAPLAEVDKYRRELEVAHAAKEADPGMDRAQVIIRAGYKSPNEFAKRHGFSINR